MTYPRRTNSYSIFVHETLSACGEFIFLEESYMFWIFNQDIGNIIASFMIYSFKIFDYQFKLRAAIDRHWVLREQNTYSVRFILWSHANDNIKLIILTFQIFQWSLIFSVSTITSLFMRQMFQKRENNFFSFSKIV